MADSTSTDLAYTPTTWADGADGGTAITAARLNNIESGVTAATKQANANAGSIKMLGDSVSQKVSFTSKSPVSDFDDLKTTGFYSVEAAHSPGGLSTVWYAVLVMRVAGNADYVTQLAMATGANSGVYFRSLDNGTWSPWLTL